ncbi:MAG: efflux RND transporter periplasmic adaptor subunit [Chitinophagaceae bacterium]|jgi:membrane fusion protein (multidrug efflux system)|nr:efflux RND transporter periplasmic adaptor subunit [Chitinophagaceae bacterium]
MKNSTSLLKKILYITIPVVLLGLVVVRLKKNKELAKTNIVQFNKEAAIAVIADTVVLQEVQFPSTFSGTFEPNLETKLSAELQGKINAVFVDVGDFVQKGQPLIQLDNSLLKLQLEGIEVQIEGLELDVRRYTILTKADAIQGVQLEKTLLALKAAKIQKATLAEQIQKTNIKAPFSGVVTAKLTEQGAFAAPGLPLLQITDIAVLKFTINIPETDLALFQIGKSYTITPDVMQNELINGKMYMVGSKANAGNSYAIQFKINNTDLSLKAGMFGKVIVKNNRSAKGIFIPSSAIIGSATNPQVYVVKNGKAIKQDVLIQSTLQNQVLLASGIVAGDVIVVNGFINLYDGANVTIK